MTEDPHHQALAHVDQPGPVQTIHPFVQAALDQLAGTPNALDGLERLMAMQRDFEKHEAKKLYDRALVELKRDLPTKIAHDKTVDYTNKAGVRTYFTHASLAQIMDAVTEALSDHGFALTWHPSVDKGIVNVTCRLSHAGGHQEEVTLSGPPDTSGNKSAVQATMSTVTLLRRYTAMALLGLASNDDREPTGEPAKPAGVTDELRMQAVAALRKFGLLEKFTESVGKPPAEWGEAEIDAARAAVGAARAAKEKASGE